MTEKELILQCRKDMEKVLSSIGTDDITAKELFVKYALDKSGKVRREAGEWIGKKGRNQFDETLQFLLQFMGNEEINVRWVLVIALGELGRKNYLPVLDAIHELSADEDWTVRESAAGALIAIHENNPDALASLESWSRDESENVRRTLAESLGRGVGKKYPEKALNILDGMIKETSLYTKKAIANSCRNMTRNNPELVIEHLEQWMKVDDINAAWTLVDATRYLANRTPEMVIPILFEMSKDKRSEVQRNVISVFREAGKYNKDLIIQYMNELKEMPEVESREVASAVITFLNK